MLRRQIGVAIQDGLELQALSSAFARSISVFVASTNKLVGANYQILSISARPHSRLPYNVFN